MCRVKIRPRRQIAKLSRSMYHHADIWIAPCDEPYRDTNEARLGLHEKHFSSVKAKERVTYLCLLEGSFYVDSFPLKIVRAQMCRNIA